MIVDCHQQFWGLERVASPWLVPDYIETFGVARLMFGSDLPVAILAGDYAKVWSETCRALELLGLAEAERAAILGDNAAVMYGIVAAS